MIRNIEFEAGYVTVTSDDGAPVKLPVSFFLGGVVAQSDLGASILDGTAAKVVATSNAIGGIPVVHQITLAAGALGDTNVTLTHKTLVIDAWLLLTGAGVATTTLQVKSTANAITDVMAASGSDKAMVRATTIDNAHSTIAAGGVLRVTSATGATQPDAIVFVLGMRVA